MCERREGKREKKVVDGLSDVAACDWSKYCTIGETVWLTLND